MWIEPEKSNSNQSIFKAHIKVGQNFIGENYPFLNSETEKFFYTDDQKKTELTQRDGDYPAINQNLQLQGNGKIYYVSKPEKLIYETKEKFFDFIDEYDLPLSKKLKKIPTETYIRYCKTLIQNKRKEFKSDKKYLKFEIINLNNPIKYNETIIKVLFDSHDFKNRKIKVFFKNENTNSVKDYTTNSLGEAKIDTSQKGLYLISAVELKNLNYIKKTYFNTDYISYWASFTFRKY